MPVQEPGLGAWELPNLDQQLRVTFRYSVRFTRDLLRPCNSTMLEAIGGHGRSRLLVVVDGGLAAARPKLLDELDSYCEAHRRRLELVSAPLVVPGGESAKNDRRVVEQVREAIERHRVDRHAYVVAIGGGAVLDAVCYAAATAHRGVRLVRVPSTVLAQNDSAVGVKNGINAYGKKNFVGSFAPPHAVIADFELLTSLSDRDWRAGISEAVKVALIRDPGFFAWLERQAHCLRERSLPAMAWLVYRCAQLHLHHIADGQRHAIRKIEMSDWLAIAMLVSGGLFAGGVVSLAWERLPAWNGADPFEFRAAFAHTLQRVDRVQPALAVVGLISTIGFAISADGGARTLAGLAAAGFGLILVGSGAWLVPLQRRLVARGPEEPRVDTEKLRRQWFRGHQIRATVALLSFTLSVVAVVS